MEAPECNEKIEDDSIECPECGEIIEKQKACWLSNLSAYCFLAVIAMYLIALLLSVFKVYMEGAIGGLFAILSMGLLVTSPVIGILALLKIYRSNNALGGKSRAILVIIASSVILAMIAPLATINFHMSGKLVCGTNVKGLSNAIYVYEHEHKDMLPEIENWCDLLISECDVSPKSLICRSSNAIYGESSYAFNENIAGMKLSELPPDIVLLFEAKFNTDGLVRDFPSKNRSSAEFFNESHDVYKDCWNMSGGPEMLAVDNHGIRGSNILLGSGEAKFVKLEKLPELRWKIKGEEIFPAELFAADMTKIIIKKASIAVIGLLVIGGAFIVLYKCLSKGDIILSLIIGVVSAGTGSFFGSLAESMYRVQGEHGAGMVSGGIVGLIVGVCYIGVLIKTSYPIKKKDAFRGYATSLGMATGILCSTLVHLLLMIIHEEQKPFGIMAGIPFGIVAGAILGSICGFLIHRFNITSKERTSDAI